MFGRDFIRKLKEDRSTGPYVEVNPLGYRIKIILRGEHLFYEEGDRALVIGLSPSYRTGHVYIHADTIDMWDDGVPVAMEEKPRIVERVISYFRHHQDIEVRVS